MANKHQDYFLEQFVMTEALRHHRKLYQKRVYEFHTTTRELFPALELKSFLLQSEKNNLAKVCLMPF